MTQATSGKTIPSQADLSEGQYRVIGQGVTGIHDDNAKTLTLTIDLSGDYGMSSKGTSQRVAMFQTLIGDIRIGVNATRKV